MGKTRDLFKKIRDTKGTFHAKMSLIKDRNGMDLTEAEDIKKLDGKNTQKNCTHAQRRYVKKPSGAKPGFVNYTHQQTIFVKAEQMEQYAKK